MIIFLDFDDTLFNTAVFKKHLEEKGVLNDKEGALSFAEKEDLSLFLFEDTTDFLKNYLRERLILITFGDRTFQRTKVVSSKINLYFEEMIFTGDSMKSVFLKEWFEKNKSKSNEKAFFLDDRIDWLHEAKEASPNLVPVRIRRGNAQHSSEENLYGYSEVRDLKEFAQLLSSF